MAREPMWEWKWEYLDMPTGRIEETTIWMTTDEAMDWHAHEHPRSRRVESSKRDRNRHDGPLIDPPAGNVDWTRETRRRAEISRYGLPPFVTPLYSELAQIWRKHRDPDVRRLALEVQTGRYALHELHSMTAEAYYYLTQRSATLEDAQKALARIRRRLHRELERIGPIDSGRR